MVNKTTNLHPAELEPNAKVIKRLKEWLARAESGDLRGVILLGVTTARGNRRTSTGEMTSAESVYLLRIMEYDILRVASLEDIHIFPEEDD